MPPDVILLDLCLPDQSGLDVHQQIRRIDARSPVIFVTMAKTADAAIEAMRQGAYDYLFKPLDPHHLRRVVSEALEVAWRMCQPAVVAEAAPDPDVDGAIVGRCPPMRNVYKAIGRVAAQDVPVLITGESGTGIAEALYQAEAVFDPVEPDQLARLGQPCRCSATLARVGPHEAGDCGLRPILRGDDRRETPRGASRGWTGDGGGSRATVEAACQR